MRRYSQVFVIVALFCFLFPFIVISPAKNAGVYQMTGWEMLTSQNFGLSKQPPVVLHIPPRTPVLMALLGGGLAVLVMLAKRKDMAWIAAAGTVVAAVSLWLTTTSTFPVQLTDGQAVLYSFENPAHQILPAYYVSLGLMGAAAVTALLGLRKQPISYLAAGAITRPAFTSAVAAVPQSSPSAVRPSSFCTKCGSAMASAARFCNRCGTAVVPLATVVKPLEAPPVGNQPPLVAAATAVAMPPVASPPPVVVSLAPTVAGPPVVAYPTAPPPLVPSSSPVRRFSFPAKLGFATAALVLAGAVWLLRPSTDNRASVGSATTVSISPLNVRVAPGATVRLQALVTGGRDGEVQWSIQEGASGGSIEPGGATVQNGTVFLLANYRAPYLPGIYHVVAASAADPRRKATAQVIVDYGFSRRF